MPDLSNLLGAVYGDSPSSSPRDPEDEAHVEHEPAAEDRGPNVPDWADDEHLDAAFAQWKPGPSADASPVEHAFVKDVDNDDPPPPLADDLAAALSEALVASSTTTHDTDVADAEAFGGPKPKAYDFSLVDDDVEPLAQVQPVHEVESVHEVEPPAEVEPAAEVEPVQPVAALAPAPESDEDDEDDAVDAVEGEDSHEPVEVSTVNEDDDLLRRPSPVTAQRAAAAELTAASRTEPESPFAPPSPEPDRVPVASVPTPVVAGSVPLPAPAAASTVTMPAGERRWERSDDDILPEKQAKKFFSLSLRRG